jgi:hypothetical protein
MDDTTHPYRYLVTAYGSSYLKSLDIYFNPGDIIYPEILRLYLDYPHGVKEYDNLLMYFSRVIAIAQRS